MPGFTIYSKMSIPETIKSFIKNQDFKGYYSKSQNMNSKKKNQEWMIAILNIL